MYRDRQVTLTKCSETLNVRWSRELPATPTTVTVNKDAAGRYFISFLFHDDAQALDVTPEMTGIDLGRKDLCVTNDGQRVKESMTVFLETRLKIPVNRSKRRVVTASRSSFLGYTFLGMATPPIRCSTETFKRFKLRWPVGMTDMRSRSS